MAFGYRTCGRRWLSYSLLAGVMACGGKTEDNPLASSGGDPSPASNSTGADENADDDTNLGDDDPSDDPSDGDTSDVVTTGPVQGPDNAPTNGAPMPNVPTSVFAPVPTVVPAPTNTPHVESADAGLPVVEPEPQMADAGEVALRDCAEACSEAGGACIDGVCTINCNSEECQSQVVCPPGADCHVQCGELACAGGVQCPAGVRACSIECSGDASCGGPVECNGSSCEIACAGGGSCGGGIKAVSAGDVRIDCSSGGACQAGATCDALSCTVACSADGSCSCLGGAQNCPLTLNAEIGVVECFGAGTCNGDIECKASESCAVACNEAFGGCGELIVCEAPSTTESCP